MSNAQHIIYLLRAFDIEPRPLDRIIDAYFRAHHELGSKTRREIADTVFDIIRWRRRLDGILQLAGEKKISNDLRLAAYLKLKEEGGVANIPIAKKFPGGAAAFYSYPDFIYDKFVEQYGKDGAAEVAEALNRTSLPVLRVNVALASREEVLTSLKEKGVEAKPASKSPYGIILSSRINLDALAEYKEGLIEPQDESSQLACIAADPKEGSLILDACAGAGGKTLMLAMLMKNRGHIVAADLASLKLRELAKRARRAKTPIIEAIETDKLLRDAPNKGKYDMVFIDAPCTGSGTFRRNPDLKWRLLPEVLKERILVQRKLLEEYSGWVRVGGVVVYATCSVLRDENEDIVGKFTRRKNFELKGSYLRSDPRLGPWDGFFTAVLTRVS